jgi:hypothetical protein
LNAKRVASEGAVEASLSVEAALLDESIVQSRLLAVEKTATAVPEFVQPCCSHAPEPLRARHILSVKSACRAFLWRRPAAVRQQIWQQIVSGRLLHLLQHGAHTARGILLELGQDVRVHVGGGCNAA